MEVLTSWKRFGTLAAALWVCDAVLSVVIVSRVPYTEIDWRAYMQEVEGWWVHGITDYRQLQGDTGPLVYPAGFVYVYTWLRWLTGGGVGPAAIAVGQVVFVAIYLATLALMLDMYRVVRPGPPWLAILLVVSKRVHSLYMLRLFNDGVAMLIVYAAVAVALRRKWVLALVLWSAAVSIKMNALLFAPAWAFLLVRNCGLMSTTTWAAVACAVALQIVVAAPFITNPQDAASYLAKAFEFSRVFMYQWTVNWKCLPEWWFSSRVWAGTLLAAHVVGLVALGAGVWCAPGGGLVPVLRGVLSRPWQATARDSPSAIAYVLFTANLVGIVASRTLHYQFYTWYFHTLPFLVAWGHGSGVPMLLRLAAVAAVEYGFNVGDAMGAGSVASSVVLQMGHAILVASVFWAGWGVGHDGASGDGPRAGTEVTDGGKASMVQPGRGPPQLHGQGSRGGRQATHRSHGTSATTTRRRAPSG